LHLNDVTVEMDGEYADAGFTGGFDANGELVENGEYNADGEYVGPASEARQSSGKPLTVAQKLGAQIKELQ